MLFFLNKMFHIKGTRWRFVPYVIRKGRSLDRIQGIKRDRSDAALFAHGGGGIPLASAPLGLPQPLLAGAHSPHPQRLAFDKVILYLQRNPTAISL